jgi:hypothetical protein
MSEQKRIRLSGAAYRKQKLKRDEEIKKNSGSFEKYLKKNNEVLNNPETDSKIILEEPNTLRVTDSLKEVGNSKQISDSIDIFNNEINTTSEDNTSIKYNENENNISDPGTWPAIFSDSLRLQLVKTGPTKPNKDFKYPRDALNRRFPISKQWFIDKNECPYFIQPPPLQKINYCTRQRKLDWPRAAKNLRPALLILL